jgi:hypothetical protein
MIKHQIPNFYESSVSNIGNYILEGAWNLGFGVWDLEFGICIIPRLRRVGVLFFWMGEGKFITLLCARAPFLWGVGL